MNSTGECGIRACQVFSLEWLCPIDHPAWAVQHSATLPSPHHLSTLSYVYVYIFVIFSVVCYSLPVLGRESILQHLEDKRRLPLKAPRPVAREPRDTRSSFRNRTASFVLRSAFLFVLGFFRPAISVNLGTKR